MFWYLLPDSNRCRRRERAVSWAARRRRRRERPGRGRAWRRRPPAWSGLELDVPVRDVEPALVAPARRVAPADPVQVPNRRVLGRPLEPHAGFGRPVSEAGLARSTNCLRATIEGRRSSIDGERTVRSYCATTSARPCTTASIAARQDQHEAGA